MLGTSKSRKSICARFGFDPGPVVGVFTPETQDAVRAYQARYGIPVSGLLDRATRRGLLPGFDQVMPR